MKRFLWRAALFLLVVGLGYLVFWPVPVAPVAWRPAPGEGYVGVYAPNDRLAALERHDLVGRHGPEDAAIGADGALYVTAASGEILRRAPDGTMGVFADTGGRPLGVVAGPDGALWVADSYRGLLRVTTDSVEMVADRTADGVPIRYADAVDLAPDGAVWVSDASTKFGAEAWGGTLQSSYLEILEHGRTGRIIRVDPATGAAETFHRGVSFANGLAMGPTGEWLLYVETGENAVRRLWIAGPRAGEVETVLAGLPGFPDNLKRDPAGGFLLGLVSKRAEAVDFLAPYPFLRKVVQRLPAAIRPKAVSHGFVIRLDETGAVTETWQDPAAGYPLTTGAVRDPDGSLWITSLSADWLGRLPAP